MAGACVVSAALSIRGVAWRVRDGRARQRTCWGLLPCARARLRVQRVRCGRTPTAARCCAGCATGAPPGGWRCTSQWPAITTPSLRVSQPRGVSHPASRAAQARAAAPALASGWERHRLWLPSAETLDPWGRPQVPPSPTAAWRWRWPRTGVRAQLPWRMGSWRSCCTGGGAGGHPGCGVLGGPTKQAAMQGQQAAKGRRGRQGLVSKQHWLETALAGDGGAGGRYPEQDHQVFW